MTQWAAHPRILVGQSAGCQCLSDGHTEFFVLEGRTAVGDDLFWATVHWPVACGLGLTGPVVLIHHDGPDGGH